MEGRDGEGEGGKREEHREMGREGGSKEGKRGRDENSHCFPYDQRKETKPQKCHETMLSGRNILQFSPRANQAFLSYLKVTVFFSLHTIVYDSGDKVCMVVL